MTIEQDKIDLTCALRAAAEMGLHEGVCNHFSYAVDGQTFLINPQGIHWLELVPSDIVTVDAAGNRIAGVENSGTRNIGGTEHLARTPACHRPGVWRITW